VKPDAENVSAALAAAQLKEDGTVEPSFTSAGASDAYPLLSVSYLITDKRKLSTSQSEVMKAFGAYAITKGQTAAQERGYLELPEEMRTSAAASIAQIEGTGGGGDDDDDDGDGGPDGTVGGLGGSSADGDDGSDGDVLSGFTDGVLAGALGGLGGGALGGDADVAAEGPIEGGLAAQKVGAAGGPAGVVRALTVFLGVPLLVALGLGALFAGRFLTVMGSREDGSVLAAFLPARMSRTTPQLRRLG
jgi:hypothetical protein